MPQQNTNRQHPHAVDLFAGAGGFSFGAQTVGWNVRTAVEKDPAAAHTYRTNIGNHDDMVVYNRDITTIDPANIDEPIEAVFGGPPCQPFSTARGEKFDGDFQETGLYHTIKWIDELQPTVFALENVDGLVNDNGHILTRLLNNLRRTGYTIQQISMNAVDYGVPQSRDRVFILGVRNDIETPKQWKPPKTHGEHSGQTTLKTSMNGLNKYKTAREAIGDLPDPLPSQKPVDDPVHLTPVGGKYRALADTTPTPLIRVDGGYKRAETGHEQDGLIFMPPNHVARNHQHSTKEKYSKWPLGYSGGRTTSRRLHPNEPSPTMTVSNGTPPVHYQGKAPNNTEPVEDVRRLTVREVARIQTFPNSYAFGGTKNDQYRQVGNAVPVRLAAHVADHLLRHVAEPLGFGNLY